MSWYYGVNQLFRAILNDVHIVGMQTELLADMILYIATC